MPPPLALLLSLVVVVSLLSLPLGGSADDLQILLEIKPLLGVTSPTWSPAATTPCSFAGVSCNNAATAAVTAIDLTAASLAGVLPLAAICRLPSLTRLSLNKNSLTGNLTNLSSCSSLTYLDLAFNSLSGAVPDLSPLTSLQVLNLSDNHLTGLFPWDSLRPLTQLTVISLGDNPFLPAPFPDSIRNHTDLQILYLSASNLYGPIPPWIGNLTRLVDIELADNRLTGDIPTTITLLTDLYMLELYYNSLTGTIPAGFRNLTNLHYLDFSHNQLHGDLSEIRFLSNLVSLQMFENDLTGGIPAEFGEFKLLTDLSLYGNRLTGALPEKLGSWAEFNFIDVSTNSLTGPIPPDMCKKGTMKKLLMLENKFTGGIPASYANCPSLVRIRLSNNSLSGTVPEGLWGLPNVALLDLSINQFEGPVAPSIGEAGSLGQLYIGDNLFSGELPEEISRASKLGLIDASSNRFTGRIPASIGGLKRLQNLDLERNQISGEIPASLGSCFALNSIDLSENSLSGPIPDSFGGLPTLNSLDLSDNQLSGAIPASLSSLKLSQLNLSSNRLAGEVPAGLSIGAYSQSFLNNPDLCGFDVNYLQQCGWGPGGSSSKIRTILISFLVAASILLASLGLFFFQRCRRLPESSRSPGFKDTWDLKSFRILSFDEQEIIDSIKSENLIGKGGSGNVYKVELGSGKLVAVKHIWNTPDAAAASIEDGKSTTGMLTKRSSSMRSREFEAEVGTLSAIRHVNVVKLYCSITSEDSSLLVYEHLPNGSLWDRLHGPVGQKMGLDWEARYEIALGAARGLEYLHHGYDRPIVHRDVKSSNILLDESFKPRIADFGLAKILHAGTVSRDSYTHVIAGTHGYIAPEYGYTWRVTEKSDVYSFGVVLMELVTGRRPIEAEYGENKDIVDWVSGKLTSKERVAGVLDKAITEMEREEVMKVLRIAVLCTGRLPAMRPSMRTVVQMLEEAAVARLVDGKIVDKLEEPKLSLDKAIKRLEVE